MKTHFFANEEVEKENRRAHSEPQLFVNVSLAIDEKGWVQLAPYGDFRNVDAAGKPVIQRFQRSDAEAIVNEFTQNASLPQRLLGLPWYVGHPDHPRFQGKPGHTDAKAYGRIKKLEARDDGLYANVKFGGAGRALLEDEAFHGHSVNWLAIPSGSENGMQIFRPVLLKSVGFTNQPQIPARPASLANDAAAFDQPLPGYAVGANPNEDSSSCCDDDDMIIPPKLKVLAGFKPDDESVTLEQILAALETTHTRNAAMMGNEKTMQTKEVELTIGDKKSVVLVNEADAELPALITKLGTDKTTAETELANAKTAIAAERKARALLVVAPLIAAGRIIVAEQDAKVTELCNAEDFDAKAKEFANLAIVVKTKAQSTDLAGKHVVMNGTQADAGKKFEALLASRASEFPNETYQDRFAAVAASSTGEQLIGQMKRSSANGEAED